MWSTTLLSGLTALLLLNPIGNNHENNWALAQSPPATQPNNNTYPPEARTNYVNSCALGRGLQIRLVCECMFAKITQTYTYPQYLDVARRVQAGEDLPKKMRDIIQQCRENPRS